jgi:transketolase
VGDHGYVLSVDRFGASAPYKKIFKEYGLAVENVIESAKQLI